MALLLDGGTGSGLMLKTHFLSSAENPAKASSLLIYDIMNHLTGKKFYPRDPDDGMYRIACVRHRARFPG